LFTRSAGSIVAQPCGATRLRQKHESSTALRDYGASKE